MSADGLAERYTGKDPVDLYQLHRRVIYAVDFDGTLVRNAWPGIGEPNTEMVEAVRERIAEGDYIILWTCREGERLAEAVAWMEAQGIPPHQVNQNAPWLVEHFGVDSRKIFADFYWDDRSRWPPGEEYDPTVFLERQRKWSGETFGPGRRTLGIIEHIRKELLEIAADPDSLEEWIDVMILALDGYWRHGGKSYEMMELLIEKQRRNMARQWPAPTSQDRAVEHIRSDAEVRRP